jgi:hypothetical protein
VTIRNVKDPDIARFVSGGQWKKIVRIRHACLGTLPMASSAQRMAESDQTVAVACPARTTFHIQTKMMMLTWIGTRIVSLINCLGQCHDVAAPQARFGHHP